MPRTLDPELRRALAERVRYCHEMGIYDFYQRGNAAPDEVLSSTSLQELREEMAPRKSAVAPALSAHLVSIASSPELGVPDPAAALKLIREDIGDCSRC